MKKFLLRLLLFCLAPLPVLLLLQHVVDEGLRKSKHFYYSEWSDLFPGKINADVLILGSSRAWVQVSPGILDSVLHVNSYNLGMDGASFNMQYERFKLYIRYNRKPKYIIQEVGYTSTLVKNNSLSGPQQFLPYLYDTAVWRITQMSNTPFTLADRYFPMYKYNNEFPLVVEGIRSYFGKGVKPVKYKGYEGMDRVWDSSFHDFKVANPVGCAYLIDPKALAQLTEFYDYCKANGIKVIMVYPPAYIESLYYITNQQEILDVYVRFSKQYNIPFYNYMYDSLDYSHDNFYNSQHLNKRGSEIFTTDLAHRMQKDM